MSFLNRVLGRPTKGREGEMPMNDLEIAIKTQDRRALEVALGDAFNEELLEVSVPVLISLCRARWHMCHEDVVSALQKVGDISAVEAIEEIAYVDFEYLNYDEAFGLARKATWALADIGDKSAKEALYRIATSPNSVNAAYANKRLQKWDIELSRKRN